MILFNFLLAYALTNLIEFVPFHLMVKKPFKEKAMKLVLINTMTLPLLWFLLPFFFEHYLLAFVIFEALVVVAETALLKVLLRLPFKQAFKVALVMNVLSAGTGFILF